MTDCIYVKYNRHRLPRFQIETSIRKEGAKKTVVKRALTPQAAEHIREIALAYSKIKENVDENGVRLPGGLRHDDSSVACDFVEGVSLDRLLLEAFLSRDASRFRKIVDDYDSLLKNAFKTVEHPVVNAKITEVFGVAGSAELEGRGPYFALTMIDPVFENVLVRDGACWLIDNEWVFEGSLPVSFVLFRSLFYFCKVKYVDFGVESLVPFESELDRLGVDAATAELYRRMDDSFQAHVFGAEWRSSHKSRYVKRRFSVPDLEKLIEHQRGVVKEMHGQIVSMKDLLRSKDELIQENDRLIRQKDGIIDDIMKSRGWRFVQDVTDKFNRACPPGTRRRRAAARLLKLPENESSGSPDRGGGIGSPS